MASSFRRSNAQRFTSDEISDMRTEAPVLIIPTLPCECLTREDRIRNAVRNDFKFVTKGHLLVLNGISLAVHLIDGILGSVIIGKHDVKVDVYAPLFTFVKGNQYFIPSPKKWLTTSILWPTVAVEFITAFFHFIYIAMLFSPKIDFMVRELVDTVFQFAYLRQPMPSPSSNSLRWVEYSITATLMTIFGNVALGMTDGYYFVKTLVTSVILQICGYAIEFLDKDSERDRLFFTIIWWWFGSAINFASVGLMLYQIFASHTGSAQEYFIENVVPFALYFNTFGIIAQMHFSRFRQFADRYFAEKYYIILSLCTKVAVYWLSFGTFRRIIENDLQTVPKTPNVNWNAVRYAAMSIPAFFLIITALYDAALWNEYKTSGEIKRSIGKNWWKKLRRTNKSVHPTVAETLSIGDSVHLEDLEREASVRTGDVYDGDNLKKGYN